MKKILITPAVVTLLTGVVTNYTKVGKNNRCRLLMLKLTRAVLASGLTASISVGAMAQTVDLADCVAINQADARLACFDQLAKPSETTPQVGLSKSDLKKVMTLIEHQNFTSAKERLKVFKLENYEDVAKQLEQKVLSEVQPIPAGQTEKNLAGYQLLAYLNPKNSRYQKKVEQYSTQLRLAKSSNTRKSYFSGLRKEIDEFTKNEVYYHPYDSSFVGLRSRISLSIVQPKNSRPRLDLRTIYVADSWLWVRSVNINIDGTSSPFTFGNFSRDNGSSIWEWFSEAPSSKQLYLLEKLSSAKRVILRFNGENFYNDKVLSQKDKKAIYVVLKAYKDFEKDRLNNKTKHLTKQFIPQPFSGSSISGHPYRCYDTKRNIVYSFSAYTLTNCSKNDYHISEDDFQIFSTLKK